MAPRAFHIASTNPLYNTIDSRALEARQIADKAARAFTITHARSDSASLHARQSNGNIVAIPTVYAGLDAGPAPGVVVGIVLGSVLGFLFLIWLFFVLSKGAGGFISANQDEEESVVVTRERRRDRSDRSRRSRGPEMSRSSPRRDRVYRQERIIRDFPPAARSPSRSRVRETVIVDDLPPPRERRVEGDDIVEVIEEHSDIDPPRRKGRRGSGYR